MKRWLRARIRAFRSFREEQTFEFPSGPGLYFLTGRNEVQPRLGANGAGKSTLWEGIYWLFSGKTTTGLTAGSVAPWDGSKGTRVELDYEDDDGSVLTLGRTWSPNRWYLVHESGADELLTDDDSNVVIQKHLGMGMLPFLHSILMAQGSDMFLDLKPEAATSLFSQVLNLDHWLDLSAKAGKMAADKDRDVRVLESKIARIEGSLDTMQNPHLEMDAKEWERRQDDKMEAVYQEHSKLIEQRKALKKKLPDLDAEVVRWKEELARTRDLRARSDDQGAGKGSGRVRDLCASEAVLLREVRKHQDAIDHAEHCDECPSCGHVLTERERDSKIREATTALKLAERELRQVRAQLEEAEAQEAAAKAASLVYSNEISRATSGLDAARRDVTDTEVEIGRLDKMLDRLEEQMEVLTSEKNPVTAAIEKLEADKRRALVDLREARAALNQAESKQRLYAFWVKGFKDIRLAQVSEALTQLEMEVNSCVTQLGLVGWKVLFKSDSENKSGSTKRGFSVEVISPANPKPVPWRSWSGGEAQRLRLAGNMGLANLIRDRMGITLPIEVWDEPTQYLSPQGVTDLLDSLSTRAHDLGRQIWVVDHRSLGYGAFDQVVTVVKDGKGSRFEFSPV